MDFSRVDREITDFQHLFLDDTPLLDVRAPVEYAQGAFPGAENLPLINDQEREQIGIRYKHKGQDQAIELGHELVQGEVKDQRVADWVDFIQRHPDGVLYCFRGGMRSKISQQWIYQQTGKVYPRVKGGYKALRRYLLEQLEASAQQVSPVILGGRTGVGKTLLLQRVKQHIDLEGIYRHRGSVFGKHVRPQPGQIDIENALSIALLKQRHANHLTLLFEDEGAAIGSRRIPDVIFHAMKRSPLVLLQASVEERVEIIFQEYIVNALAEYQQRYGAADGFHQWSTNLLEAMNKIQRRLGGQRHRELHDMMQQAIQKQRELDEAQHHKQWIHHLLVDYYDPMYDYQTSAKTERVVFRGEADEVLEFLRQQYGLE
jgi:tRNA 2-selenouridine synthase